MPVLKRWDGSQWIPVGTPTTGFLEGERLPVDAYAAATTPDFLPEGVTMTHSGTGGGWPAEYVTILTVKENEHRVYQQVTNKVGEKWFRTGLGTAWGSDFMKVATTTSGGPLEANSFATLGQDFRNSGDPPSAYPVGISSFEIAGGWTTGWYMDGVVVTVKETDDRALQIITDTNTGRVRIRTTNEGFDAWQNGYEFATERGGVNFTNIVGCNVTPTSGIHLVNKRFVDAQSRTLHMTGGGTVTFNASAQLRWSQRFIIIAEGRGAQFSTSGYFNIDMPPDGTVIPGVGGAGDVTVVAGGIPISGWHALYYILPIGGNNVSQAANFRVAHYSVNLEVPSNWVLIAVRNSDKDFLTLGTRDRLHTGTSLLAETGNTSWHLINSIDPGGLALNSINVDFQGIPTRYTRLRLVVPWMSHNSTSNSHLYMRFNGDAGGNYASHMLYHTSAAEAGTQASSQTLAYLMYSYFYGGGGRDSHLEVDIYEQTSKVTLYNAFWGTKMGVTTYSYGGQSKGSWNNLGKVNRIQIWGNLAATWEAGSRFYLYGSVD